MLKRSDRGAVDSMILTQAPAVAPQKEAHGERVLHLEIGQPGAQAPQKMRAAAALETDQIGYTVATGVPPLHQAITAHYRTRCGGRGSGRGDGEHGSTGGFVLAFVIAFEAGDQVGLLEPSYPAYRNILHALDVAPAPIPVGAETRYQPDPDDSARLSPDLDGLLLASPANSTSAMLSDGEIAIQDGCAHHGVRFISDEIYHGIT